MQRYFLAVLALAGAITCARAETCRASWYGYTGNRTASGEVYRPHDLTVAHRSLPFGARLRVTLGSRSVIVRVSDRGPAKWTHRCLDLSEGAARALGMIRAGVALVRYEVVRE
ncbi:Endolytic peptidoglycan transglycosylase RlpA [Labrys miyagiensis]